MIDSIHFLDNYKPKQNQDWQLHWLNDHPVLFAKSHDGLHLLNPVAGFIWTCCDGKTDVSEIRQALQEVFVDDCIVEKDLFNIFKLWEKQKLIDFNLPEKFNIECGINSPNEENSNKIAVISTVKAPIKELRLFVNYHLNIGVDNIILFFDDPLNEGIKEFANYKEVHTIKCSFEYWLEKIGERPNHVTKRQIFNVNEGVKIAESNNCNWIIHIDSDELVNPLEKLKQVLSKCNADAVRFSVMEAVSDSEQYEHIFIPTLFKKKSNKNQIKLAKFLGCSNAVFDNEYIRGHTASKMAIKISSKIKTYKIHDAKTYSGNLLVENTKKIQLLHYDCVGINSWISRWNRQMDGPKNYITIRRNRYKQFLLYQQAKGQQELSNLYKRLHCIPIWERIILYLLGMLESVKLNKDLFDYKSDKI